MKHKLIVVMATLGLSATLACGGDGKSPIPTAPSSPSTGNPSPAPPAPPAPGPFSQTFTGNVGSRDSVFHQFVAPRDGMASVKLTWADGNADLDLVLTAPSCQALYGPNNNCVELVSSALLTGTEENITYQLTAGQAYRVWVDNFAYSAQAYTIKIDIP